MISPISISISGHCSQQAIPFRHLLNGRLFVYVEPVKFARHKGKVFFKLDKSRIQLLEDSNVRFDAEQGLVREVHISATVPELEQ